MKSRPTAYLLLILATGLWGIGGPIIKYSFNFIDPYEFLFWRFVIVAILSLPFFVWYLWKHPIKLSDLHKILILGMFGTVLNLALSFLALDHTSVVQVAIIGSLNPMLVAICGAIFLGEYIGKGKKIGIALAIAGSVVAVLNPIIESGGQSLQSMLGNFLIVLSGITWLFFVLLSKKWESETLRPLHIVVISSYLGVLSFAALSYFENGSMPTLQNLTSGALPGILYMAIFGSLIAYTAYTTALTVLSTSDADIFGYVSPLWSIPIAVFWLGERFDPALIISAILIVLGVYLAERREKLRKDLKAHHVIHHKV